MNGIEHPAIARHRPVVKIPEEFSDQYTKFPAGHGVDTSHLPFYLKWLRDYIGFIQ